MADPKRLFISADIEGIGGVVTRTETAGDGRDFGMARRWMTNEVVAACDAARSAGVGEIVIADSHGGGDNLLLDDLHGNVQVVRSWPRELAMVQGVECGSFVGAAFIGYHAGSRAESGILAHTFCSDIQELTLNGEVMSETTFNAALVGGFGVPVILATGDDVYTKHVRDVLPTAETATVKWAHGNLSARTMTPPSACEEVAKAMTAALRDVDAREPYRIDGPVEMVIETTNRVKAEILSYVPTVSRLDSHRICLSVENMVAASRFISLFIHVNATY